MFYNSKPASRVGDYVACLPESSDEIKELLRSAADRLAMAYGEKLTNRQESSDHGLDEKVLETLDEMIKIHTATDVWFDSEKKELGSNVFTAVNIDALALVARVSHNEIAQAGRRYTMWFKEQNLGSDESDLTSSFTVEGLEDREGLTENDVKIEVLGHMFGTVTRLDFLAKMSDGVEYGDDGSLDTQLTHGARHDEEFYEKTLALFNGDSQKANHLLASSLDSIDVKENADGTWTAAPTMDFYAIYLELADVQYREYAKNTHGSDVLTPLRWTVTEETYNLYEDSMMQLFDLENISELEETILSKNVSEYQKDLVDLTRANFPDLGNYANKSYDTDGDGKGDTYDISEHSKTAIRTHINMLASNLIYDVAFRCGDEIATGSNDVLVGP